MIERFCVSFERYKILLDACIERTIDFAFQFTCNIKYVQAGTVYLFVLKCIIIIIFIIGVSLTILQVDDCNRCIDHLMIV